MFYPSYSQLFPQMHSMPGEDLGRTFDAVNPQPLWRYKFTFSSRFQILGLTLLINRHKILGF
jgi:hypothetical protein